MKSSELAPNFDNLFDTFIGDTIGRDQDVFDFCQIIDSIEGSYCIAIDAPWEAAKPFL